MFRTLDLSDVSFLTKTVVSDFDTDAQAYITAVETADGQALEAGVATSINNFVVGCKADGIWDAIKASCIMAGARTLSGALIPLKGTAPTNNNFVSGDYDRKTGLVGNGTTKYLDSNRNNNADPQNNLHQSVYATTTNSNILWYLGAGVSNPGATHIYSDPPKVGFRNRAAQPNASSSTPNNAGFIGMGRSSASSFVGRAGGTSLTISRSSDVPYNGDVFVFLSNGSTAAYSDARLSFYSIGEDLDLAQLDNRVSALMTAIDGAIP